MSCNDKTTAKTIISMINAVDGFDPNPLAVEYTDMNTGETRLRLPVMSQVAWFRLKYPDGRFMINVAPGKDCFIATARVYKNYMDPVDCFLSEATASRGYLPDKPTVSPREWAQTAALGIALRNAGFGLQFHAAGESFDEPAVNELGQNMDAQQLSDIDSRTPDDSEEYMSAMPSVQPVSDNNSRESVAALSPVQPSPGTDSEETAPVLPAVQPTSEKTDTPTHTGIAFPAESSVDPLEAAMKTPCPITKYSGKTLGDLIIADPRAIVWVATKFTGNPDISKAAKMICEHSQAIPA